MKPINRRQFLKESMGAAVAFTALSSKRTFAANNKITIGIMGLGGRGVSGGLRGSTHTGGDVSEQQRL